MRKHFLLLFYTVFLLSVLIPSSLHAEEENMQPTTVSHFFIAILAGLMLACGFQMLLTFLSVASGVSFIPNIEKPKVTEVNKGISALKNKSLSSPIPLLITSGFGIWSVITTSLSLFFASFLALRLSIAATPGIAVALGLVIWAGFFMLMIYLEIQTAGTVLGKGLSTAMAGFKALHERLNMYNHNSLVALITSNEHFTKDEADKIISKIEEAKDIVLKKAEKIEAGALKNMEETKQLAIHEADVTRRTAVSAAWWLFITASISGIAAVVGGILG